MGSFDRVALVGTAQSWAQTPWHDQGLTIISLNDAYMLQGFQRADEWYDLHPLDHFLFIEPGHGPIHQHEIPPGHYCRPKAHLEWLERQSATIPIWLNPEYLSQHPAAATWAQARAFPRADVEAMFGRYEMSSPALMLAHFLLRGVKELHIYGIHLSTEFEYMRQRPNFEYFLGMFLGIGAKRMDRDGKRYYESRDHERLLVLPASSPVLQEDFQYAFEPRPDAHLAALQWEVHRHNVKHQRAAEALMRRKWLQWPGTLEAEKFTHQVNLEAAQQALQHAQVSLQWR